MSPGILNRNRWSRRAAAGTVFGAVMACGLAAADERADKNDPHHVKTDTPIKHLIVFIGENRTFDHIYATYHPKRGQSVANLLSKGIIDSKGMRGPHYIRSQQFQINQPYPSTYFIDALVTAGKTGYLQSPGTIPTGHTAFGWGNPAFVNTGCEIEFFGTGTGATACTGNTKLVRQIGRRIRLNVR